jgi:hypothetical protein
MKTIPPLDAPVNLVAALVRNFKGPCCVACQRKFKRRSQVGQTGVIVETWGIALYQLCKACAPSMQYAAFRARIEFDAISKAKGAVREAGNA